MIPALIVAALVVLVVLACLVDRAIHRWLTGRAGIALSIEDSADGDWVESGGSEPVVGGLGPALTPVFTPHVVPGLMSCFDRPSWATAQCEEHPRVLTTAEETAIADFGHELVDAAQFQEPAPTLREQLLARGGPVPGDDLGHIQPPQELRNHRCGTDCAHRPPVYTGPIILGRRCSTCSGPTTGTSICDSCWDAEDRVYSRRVDR